MQKLSPADGFEPLLTVAEVAEYLRCSVEAAYKIIRHEGLPHIRRSRKGNRVLVKPSDLRDWMAARTQVNTPDLDGPPPTPRVPALPVPGYAGRAMVRPTIKRRLVVKLNP